MDILSETGSEHDPGDFSTWGAVVLEQIESCKSPSRISESLYVGIHGLCGAGLYSQAEQLIENAQQSLLRPSPFTFAFCKASICNRRGDFQGSLRFIQQEFTQLSPMESMLLSTAKSILEIRFLDNPSAALSKVHKVQQQLVQVRYDPEESPALLGSYTPLEIFRLTLMAMTLGLSIAEQNLPSAQALAAQLVKTAHGFLRAGAHSLAFMCFSEAGKLDESPSASLEYYAALAAEKGLEREELRMRIMRLEWLKGDSLVEKSVFTTMKSSCQRLQMDRGTLQLALLEARLDFKDLFGISSTERQYVTTLSRLQDDFRGLGDFLGEWDVCSEIVTQSVNFIDQELTQQGRRRALLLLERWGVKTVEIPLRLNFANWFFQHGRRTSAMEHARAAYSVAATSSWARTVCATVLSVVTSENERYGWAHIAYEESKKLNPDHIVCQEAAVALANISSYPEAAKTLYPHIIQRMAVNSHTTVLEMLRLLWAHAFREARQGRPGYASHLMEVCQDIIPKITDSIQNASFYLFRQTGLCCLQLLHHQYDQALDSCRLAIDAAMKHPVIISQALSARHLLSGILEQRSDFDGCLRELEACLVDSRGTSKATSIQQFASILAEKHSQKVFATVRLTLSEQVPRDEAIATIMEHIQRALEYAGEAEAAIDTMRSDYNSMPPADALVAKGELNKYTAHLYNTVLPLIAQFRSTTELWCWVQASKSRNFLEVASVLKYFNPTEVAAGGATPLATLDRHFTLTSARSPLMDARAISTENVALNRYQQVFSQLPDKTVVIEWIVVLDILHVLIADGKTRPIVVSLDKSYTETSALISSLCQPGVWLFDCAEILESLSFLIGPIQSHTEENQQLLLVPTRELYRVPFHALKLTDGRYLIERNAISYTLSLVVSAGSRRTDTSELSDQTLVAAYPANTTPGFRQEAIAQGIRLLSEPVQGVRPTTLLHGSSLTVDNLLAAMPQAALIYLLSHAEPAILGADVDPLSASFLLCDNHRLTARRITEMSLKASLTVLAGCASLQGQTSASDDYIGFITSFLLAGSASVLGTLFPVFQDDTNIITTKFFHSVLQTPECSLPVLLRKTILGYMRQPGKREPKHWGAYVLYGETQSRTESR